MYVRSTASTNWSILLSLGVFVMSCWGPWGCRSHALNMMHSIPWLAPSSNGSAATIATWRNLCGIDLATERQLHAEMLTGKRPMARRDLDFGWKKWISAKFRQFRSGPVRLFSGRKLMYFGGFCSKKSKIWSLLEIYMKIQILVKFRTIFVLRFKIFFLLFVRDLTEICEIMPFRSGPVYFHKRNPNPAVAARIRTLVQLGSIISFSDSPI